MTISGDGGELVPGPACRPVRYGLSSVAELDSRASNEGWPRGLEWDEQDCSYDPGVLSGQCPPLAEDQTKTTSRGFDTKYADAFTVYAGWECSTATPISEAWNKAEALLDVNLWRAIERTFWTGLDQDDNPVRETLATADATDLTPAGGALDIVSGVGVLESFAGDCFDCEPIIHANRGLAPFFSNLGLTERDGDQQRLKTTGTLFVPGGGYANTGPDGEAADPGEAWLYVTGGVRVTMGPRFFTPERGDEAGAVDRIVNDVVVFAERIAALQVGCCVGAVRVVLAGTAIFADEES